MMDTQVVDVNGQAIPPPPPPPTPENTAAAQVTLTLREIAKQRAAAKLANLAAGGPAKERQVGRGKIAGVHIDRPRWAVLLTAGTVGLGLMTVPVLVAQRTIGRHVEDVRSETATAINASSDRQWERFVSEFQRWETSTDPNAGLLPIIDARIAQGPTTIVRDDPFAFAAPMGLKVAPTARTLLGGDATKAPDAARATDVANQALRLVGAGAKPEALTIAQVADGKLKVSAGAAGEAALFVKITAGE